MGGVREHLDLRHVLLFVKVPSLMRSQSTEQLFVLERAPLPRLRDRFLGGPVR